MGNVQEAIRAVILNTAAQKPPCSFFRQSHFLRNGAVSFPDGTTRGFEAQSHTTSPTVNGSILLHHVSQFASARTQESCSLLHRVEEKPAIMSIFNNRRSCLTPSVPHLLLHVSITILTQSSSLMSHQSIIRPRGMISLVVIPGRRKPRLQE